MFSSAKMSVKRSLGFFHTCEIRNHAHSTRLIGINKLNIKRWKTNLIDNTDPISLAKNIESTKQTKLVKALYRNLLRWCTQMEKQTQNNVTPIPLDPMPPPVTLLPSSNLDVYLLADLAAFVERKQQQTSFNLTKKQEAFDNQALLSHLASLLPPNSSVESNRLTLSVTSLEAIRKSIQIAFKMSPCPSSKRRYFESENWQEQISMGFDTLRNLKEHIQPILEERWKQRQYHLKREGIHFRVGQVVKHKSQKWRGIVFSWKHFDDIVTNDVDFKLTKDQKQLSKDLGALYSVLVDSTDLQRLQQEVGDSNKNTNTENHIQHIPQCDLEEVAENRLTRIRNPFLSTKFEKLDLSCSYPHFTPKPSLAYEFPLDLNQSETSHDKNKSFSNVPKHQSEIVECCKKTIRGIQLLTFHLRHVVSASAADEIACITTSSPASASMPSKSIVDTLEDQLDSILLECESCQAFIFESPVSVSLLKSNTAKTLSSVNTFISHVFNAMSQRRLAIQYSPQTKYQLGSIVREKTNGFRCVVVGYTFPLSKTNHKGVNNTSTRGTSSLFYHLKPDMNDVNSNFRIGENNMNPFGFDRIFYAHEHQLSTCTPEETKLGLEVDLDNDGWIFEQGVNECKYIPPDEIKFQYGRALENEDSISMLMMSLMSEILQIQYSIQTNSVSTTQDKFQIQDIISHLSLDNLFLFLRNSDSADSSKILEDFIHEIFNAHSDISAREMFADGARHLMHGESNGALEIFHSLLVEYPTYFECWNKIATSHFLNGSMDDSLYATEQALSFEPRHYSAMAGLGLIKQSEGDIEGAVKAFSDCLDYSPWSMVSSTLSSCIDQLESNKTSREVSADPYLNQLKETK